jgi:hypothetical protein
VEDRRLTRQARLTLVEDKRSKMTAFLRPPRALTRTGIGDLGGLADHNVCLRGLPI